MIHLRLYYKRIGGHIHCRLFSGKDAHLTHGKNGDLVFDEREWSDVYDKLSRVADIQPEPALLHGGGMTDTPSPIDAIQAERFCNCRIDVQKHLGFDHTKALHASNCHSHVLTRLLAIARAAERLLATERWIHDGNGNEQYGVDWETAQVLRQRLRG